VGAVELAEAIVQEEEGGQVDSAVLISEFRKHLVAALPEQSQAVRELDGGVVVCLTGRFVGVTDADEACPLRSVCGAPFDVVCVNLCNVSH
jgi:hypothetical protein